MKKIISAATVAALALAGVLVASSAASATQENPPPTETCVPSEAWTETKVITPEVPAIPAVPEVAEVSHTEYQRYSWVGGPTEVAPTEVPPGDNWQANTTNYEGAGHGTDPIGEPFAKNENGKADWFFWTATKVIDTPYSPGIPEVPAVPAVTETINHPAVTCEEPPTTYLPACTTVLDYQTITGSGVISVPGGWESESISVPLNGVSTLADIGTHLDITADPIQYVGLHIRTPEGSISFEEEPSYGGNLWSTSTWEGVEAGMGYAAFGSIEDYIYLNGDVAVTGIDLLYTHPEASSTTVASFTIGCTTYEFTGPIPEKPADVVVTSDWSAVEVTCDNEPLDVIQQTRTISTTPFVWNADEWAWVEGETSVVTEGQGYVVTSADIEALDCPVTAEPTPTTTPAAVKPNPTALAATGGGINPLIGFGALALVLAGLGVTVAARRR